MQIHLHLTDWASPDATAELPADPAAAARGRNGWSVPGRSSSGGVTRVQLTVRSRRQGESAPIQLHLSGTTAQALGRALLAAAADPAGAGASPADPAARGSRRSRWHPDYLGGDYDDTGELTVIEVPVGPAADVTDAPVEAAFTAITGQDPIHIIRWVEVYRTARRLPRGQRLRGGHCVQPPGYARLRQLPGADLSGLCQGRSTPLPSLRLMHHLPWVICPLSGPGTPAWPASKPNLLVRVTGEPHCSALHPDPRLSCGPHPAATPNLHRLPDTEQHMTTQTLLIDDRPTTQVSPGLPADEAPAWPASADLDLLPAVLMYLGQIGRNPPATALVRRRSPRTWSDR